MEINVVAGHIDHDGGVIGDIDEFKIDTTIAGGGKFRTVNAENLHGRSTVTVEGDELLIVFYDAVVDSGVVVVIGEPVTDRVFRFIVVVLVSVDRSY